MIPTIREVYIDLGGLEIRDSSLTKADQVETGDLIVKSTRGSMEQVATGDREQDYFCLCFEMRYSTIEAFDRTMLLAWLLKDFGWMSENAYIGIPFGIMSLWLHGIFLIYDRRVSMTWINISLMLWITGNFIWMLSEFIYTRPSVDNHLGPELPLGGLPEEDEQQFLNLATALFVIGVSSQLVYYVLVGVGKVSMPGEEGVDEDDVLVRSDIQAICCQPSSARSRAWSYSSNHSRSRSFDETPPKNLYTSTFIENAYVCFWILKDMFWALGTGSIEGISGRNPQGREIVKLFESMAIISAAGSFLAYAVTAYLMRRNGIRFLDAISAACWVLANTVWMCGEFFFRYDSLLMDDEDQGSDVQWREASTFFFSVPIMIQAFVVVKLTMMRCNTMAATSQNDPHVQHNFSSVYSPFGANGAKQGVYTPQKGQDGDIESIVF